MLGVGPTEMESAACRHWGQWGCSGSSGLRNREVTEAREGNQELVLEGASLGWSQQDVT